MGAISLKYKSKSGNLTAPGDADPGAFIPLATTTLTTSTATVTFSAIPQDYEHLQIRWFARGSSLAGLYWTFNSDTDANYARHRLSADGSTVGAAGLTSQNQIYTVASWGIPNTASIFATGTYDILDYKDTTKYTTMRGLAGQDSNGSGGVELVSGLWMNTAAVTAISITPNTGTFQQYTSFALYGIKRAGA
jgi:hypothetical protein